MKKKVLALLANGFEEIEAATPFDLLHRAEIALTIASVGADANGCVRGRSSLLLHTDAPLETLAGTPPNYASLGEVYDALLLPGGSGTYFLRKDGRAAALASAFAEKGKPVAAICAAPLILLDAGLLSGKRVAAHTCAWDEIPAARNCARVELDGNILTSRGAGTAFDFALALVELLAGRAVAADIEAATMA